MEQLRWIRMLAYHERPRLPDDRGADSWRAGRARAYRRLWTELRREVLRVVARTGNAGSRARRFHDLSAPEERNFVLCATTGGSIGAVVLVDSADGVRCRYWRDGAPATRHDFTVAFESDAELRLIVDDGRERRAFGSAADLASHLMTPLLTAPPAARSRKRRG
jgi:hypothetical protein